MTAEEEAHLAALAEALDLDFAQLRSKAPDAFEELVVCRINDGRPPTLPDPPILTKRGETAFGTFTAALMKEVARREYRGRGASVSIPLGGGMRYRVGNTRGKSVVVGTELVAADTGTLVITSTRTLFTGQKKTWSSAPTDSSAWSSTRMACGSMSPIVRPPHSSSSLAVTPDDRGRADYLGRVQPIAVSLMAVLGCPGGTTGAPSCSIPGSFRAAVTKARRASSSPRER
jgi:hypothetical protein